MTNRRSRRRYRAPAFLRAHVADAGGGGGDLVADRAGIAGGGAQDHRGLGGFGHPQPHPDRKELSDREAVFGGSSILKGQL